MQEFKKMNTSRSETVLYGALAIPTDKNHSWVVPTNLSMALTPGMKSEREAILFQLENADEAKQLFDTIPPRYASGVFVPRYAVWYQDQRIGTIWIDMFEILAGIPFQIQELEEKLPGLNLQLGETLAAVTAWNLFRGSFVLDPRFVRSCCKAERSGEGYLEFRDTLERMAEALMNFAGKTLTQNTRFIENGRHPSNFHSGLLIRDLRQTPGFGLKHFGVEVIWGADLGSSPAKFSYRQQLPSFADLYAPEDYYSPSQHQAEVIDQVLPHMAMARSLVRPCDLTDTDTKAALDPM